MSLGAVPIITYHSVEEGASPLFTSPAVFKAQLASLADRGFEAVALKEVLERLRNHLPIPERIVVLTFDDGYSSVFDTAWPQLQEHGWKATVFLVAGYCGKDNQWPSQSADVPRRPIMSWDQAGQLAADGWEIGVHTLTHGPLPLLSPDQIEDELAGSQEMIRRTIGQDAGSFAYPYGATDARVQGFVERYFDGAAGVRLGLVTSDSDLYCLERVDAYYLPPRLIRWLDRPGFAPYLGVRQGMRDLRRRFRPDWRVEAEAARLPGENR